MSRERLVPIEENPTSRLILAVYEPVLRFMLAHKFSFAAAPLLIILLGAGAWFGLPAILYPAGRPRDGWAPNTTRSPATST
jgi:Cu(I)/Ag(I) efflux system membrane protein CusA/SilA